MDLMMIIVFFDFRKTCAIEKKGGRLHATGPIAPTP